MAEFIAKTKRKSYNTKYRLQFIKITNDIEHFIQESGLLSGSVVIQTNHTTCSLWMNEDEKNLIGPSEEIGYINDLKRVLDRFAGPEEEYHHNDVLDSKNTKGKRDTHLCIADENGVINECMNGHAHAQAMVLQSSLTLIVEDGKLAKGPWQEVLLVELDHDRERTITMLAQGIAKR
ncbi:MAG TPA: YjbQ family protein [Candidatus Nanoarchaeia archaeon]|nr:YjbQ family protein [Candidatus Nanoarchaeia archaeon]